MAVIVYGIENLHYGDDDPETGTYLMRYTVALSAAGIPCETIDRKPIARFEDSMEARRIDDAIKAKTFHLMPNGWNHRDIPVRGGQ